MDTLSVVTITLNEAHRLRECFESIDWADEWVVVDSGSSDGTAELAQRLSARVFRRPFDNFSNQWNFAAGRARSDWVLVLAADERITPGLRSEIEAVLQGGDGPSCYAMPRRNVLFGRWMRYGGQYPDWSLRLFRRGTARWVGDIHERLAHAGRLGRLRQPILHLSFSTLGEWIKKMDRQTDQEAFFAAQRGERASWTDVALRPAYWFLRMYVARRGFLDRWEGFVHSLCTFTCVFFRYAKLRELGARGEGGSKP
ncbi:MAG: glycosyltransferase family 2 protein [Dehalococcoidia bacterium]|nr:glycosyltransferase family 2 protein [Dehalococcoidia bacterium]